MRRFANRIASASLFFLAVCASAQQPPSPKETTIRGWLSDEVCARGRASSGTFTGTSPRCAKECVAKGRKIVLVDPDRKVVFDIANQDPAKKNVGDYVEVAGRVDLKTKTIRIGSLKMVSVGMASCERAKSDQAKLNQEKLDH